MTRNSPSKSDRSPPSSYSRTDTDNSRRGGSSSSRKGKSRRSHSDSRSRSRSRSRDRGGSRSKKSSRSHRRHDRSRSRERSSRRDRSRSRSRSHRRSRSRSGSRSRNEDRASAQRKASAGVSEAVASRAASTAAASVPLAAPTTAALSSVPVATSVASSVAAAVAAATAAASAAPHPGVSAALAAARAAAIRSGLMPVEALSAPPPLTLAGTLPSYYNPTQVNALKYSEQMQKRKLLWKKPQAEGTGSTPAEAPADKQQQQPTSTCAKVWERMTFAEDQDGKVTAKFRKLMGIRGDPPPPSDTPDPAANPLLRQQEKLFHDLDQQYEAARVSTHTHRGVGLGYSSQVAAYFQQAATSLNNPK